MLKEIKERYDANYGIWEMSTDPENDMRNDIKTLIDKVEELERQLFDEMGY